MVTSDSGGGDSGGHHQVGLRVELWKGVGLSVELQKGVWALSGLGSAQTHHLNPGHFQLGGAQGPGLHGRLEMGLELCYDHFTFTFFTL